MNVWGGGAEDSSGFILNLDLVQLKVKPADQGSVCVLFCSASRANSSVSQDNPTESNQDLCVCESAVLLLSYP